MPPDALLLSLLHLCLLLLESLDRVGGYLLLLILLSFLGLALRGRLVEQGEFSDRIFLLAHHILQRRPFFYLRPAPFPPVLIFIFEANIFPHNNPQILLAFELISGALQFLMHLLAEAIAVPDSRGQCSELPDELNLKQVGHGVKANKQLTLSMFLDALDEEIPLLQLCDDSIEVGAGRKGDE